MNTCENCIHKDLCKDMHKFGVTDLPYNDNSAACEHYKTESPAYHTLRLIYADFMERSNRSRTIAESLTFRGIANTVDTRRVADIYASAASRIQYYCRKIDFDPKTNHTEGETK